MTRFDSLSKKIQIFFKKVKKTLAFSDRGCYNNEVVRRDGKNK